MDNAVGAPLSPDVTGIPAGPSGSTALPAWLLPPSYAGTGIAAIPNTILAHFGVEPRLDPLHPTVLPPALLDGARTVILILIDALGFDQLLHGIRAGACPNLSRLLDGQASSLTALTSIFPSTTAAALTTLATGEPPVRHGMAGYTLWLEKVGGVVNMIRFRPLAGQATAPSPEDFLPVPTIFQLLAAVGVESEYVNLQRLLGSGLSVMHSKEARVHPYVGFADMCCTIRRLVEQSAGQRRYIHAYWDAVDGVAHLRGPRTVEHDAELAAIDFSLGRELLDRIKREDVLLLIAADHGHCETAPEQAVWLDRYPELIARLAHPPAGERRAVYLDPRSGETAAVEDWFRRHAPASTVVMEREEVLRQGWWGPPPFWPAGLDRLGRVVVLPAPQEHFPYRWSDSAEERVPPIGAHGGLTRQEALVPLLAARLE